MAIKERDVRRYKERLETAKEQRAHWQGQLESLEQRLKDEYGVDNEAEAEEAIAKLEEEIEGLQETMEALAEELEDILDN